MFRPSRISTTPPICRSSDQVVAQEATRHVGGHAEQREDHAETEHEREGVQQHAPALSRRLDGRGHSADGDRRAHGAELAEIGRHDRQHARRQERNEAGEDGRRHGQVHRQASRPSVTSRNWAIGRYVLLRVSFWPPTSSTGSQAP